MTEPHLYPYQRPILAAALQALTQGLGGPLCVMMARQSGKNETSAYIERAAMVLNHAERRTGIKCAPTLAPQANISRDRLVAALAPIHPRQEGQYVHLGRARWGFLSAEPSANVVGHTADLLLEADEAQDINVDKFNKDFRPMAAVSNAPIVYYGTPWTDDDLLAQAAREAQDRQGDVREGRLHIVPWYTAAGVNPAYADYVAGERHRLGANHPLFLTQYEMKTLPNAGRLLSPQQLASIFSGDHPARQLPDRALQYVAGIDVAGEDPNRTGQADSTVLSIGSLSWSAGKREPPAVHVQALFETMGAEHASLYPHIAATLQAWNVRRVAVDATALGEALSLYLQRAIGDQRVIPVRFTQRSKSDLGYGLQAAANTRRLVMHANDQSPEYSRALAQLTACRADYRPNRTVAWSVPESEGHDDYAVSLALLVHAAEQAPPPAIARGTIAAEP